MKNFRFVILIFLLLLNVLFNFSYAQGILSNRPNSGCALPPVKFFDAVSVFGNISEVNYLGRLSGESSSKGNFGFNFGLQADFKNKYAVFISDDYIAYKYRESPNGDHIYRISCYNIGFKYKLYETEENQKFLARLGLGPYLYERNKDDNGGWVLNKDEVCFGVSLGMNCDVPLADFLSLNIDPVFHSFKTKDKSWLSFFSLSAGLRLYLKV